MEIISGFELSKGTKVKVDERWGQNSYFQPLQFLPEKEKTPEWCAQMISFAEWEGLRQIRENANKFSKNYKLSIGEIEKSDYIRENNEYADVIDTLEQKGGSVEAMELKFFPLIPTAINVLVDEFAKRYSHISFDDKSDIGYNEMLEEKSNEIEQVLLAQATIKQQAKLMEMGLSADSEQGKQMLDPATLKTLPEIENFYNKSYRNIYQEWAVHQKNVDEDRFRMPELEKINFRNSLITDREFWHFRMMENDYQVEIWNPAQVFYRKSPGCLYMSDASWIGYATYMTIPDIIDRSGYKMSEEQLLSLNTVHAARGASYMLDGKEPDQYYDVSKSYEWNRTGPGLGMRQVASILDGTSGFNGDIVRQILNEGEDAVNVNGQYLVRVSTVYWKTQRKMFHLTKIDENGELIQDIVGENYKITDKPMYNTVLYKEKTKENLIYGEHLDPLWVNEVWGGERIGPNVPAMGWMGTTTGFAPIYLGINGGKPGRLPFQFKGDNNIAGCKLPVEGRVYNDYNTKSRAFVDNLKPYQIGFNLCNNLLQDTVINDLGVIVAIDPNALPKHSMGEDWGPDNFTSALSVARDMSVLPIHGAGRNTDGQPIGSRPVERIDLSQSERLVTLAKMAQYFKEEGLSSVGLNPQRVGTPIDQEQTATGINQAVQASYSQTEYLFSQHSDDLMPRVHQMRTDLAQYYNCTNPSLRLQYITTNEEKVNFKINGTKLLGRDFNVSCKTTINARNILQQIKQLLLTNNTSGANLFDLVRGIKIETVAEMDTLMKSIEKREESQQQQQMQQEQTQHEQSLQQQMQLLQEKQQWEAQENQKDRDAKIYETEIMAASRAATARPPQEGEDVYQNALDKIQQQDNFQQTMNLNREKHITQTALEQKKLTLQQQKVQAENKRTQAQLQIDKVNTKVKEKNKPPKK